jgi:hypothetical protein
VTPSKLRVLPAERLVALALDAATARRNLRTGIAPCAATLRLSTSIRLMTFCRDGAAGEARPFSKPWIMSTASAKRSCAH